MSAPRQIEWSEVADRASGRVRERGSDPQHARAVRTAEIARELTADAAEHGPASGRCGDGWSRGEMAEDAWGWAAIRFLAWALGGSS